MTFIKGHDHVYPVNSCFTQIFRIFHVQRNPWVFQVCCQPNYLHLLYEVHTRQAKVEVGIHVRLFHYHAEITSVTVCCLVVQRRWLRCCVIFILHILVLIIIAIGTGLFSDGDAACRIAPRKNMYKRYYGPGFPEGTRLLTYSSICLR